MSEAMGSIAKKLFAYCLRLKLRLLSFYFEVYVTLTLSTRHITNLQISTKVDR